MPRLPDELFQREASAAASLGIEFSLVDFEALVNLNDADKAVRKVRQTANAIELAIYRGWMLSPTHYQALYDALLRRGIKLINDPASYKHCHYLPQWLPLFEKETPHSAWLDKESFGAELIGSVMQLLSVFAGKPVIVKDYVKSEKHHWVDACFIPDSSDRERVERVVSRFLELRGDDLEGGLVFRRFVNFKALATHSKSGMPLTKEFRLFVLNGQIVHWFKYWEEGDYGHLLPPLAQFANLVTKPKSHFFTMDVAQAEDGQWFVVELGDGQVAGLPETVSAVDFYSSLSQASTAV